ncbi:MAG: deoxycytidylate deaminase [Flavobacteriales bacterium]|jgi:deoxycytidylate deaminase
MDELYRLRKDFVIIGLTGKSGAGCTEVAKKLNNPKFIEKVEIIPEIETNDVDQIKYRICHDFLKWNRNWTEFQIIKYADVLIIHLLWDSFQSLTFNEEFKSIILSFNLKDNDKRFNKKDINNAVIQNFQKNITELKAIGDSHSNINEFLIAAKDAGRLEQLLKLSSDIITKLREINYHKTSLLLHDLANNIRGQGTTNYCQGCTDVLKNIYTVAETINQLIKLFKNHENKGRRIVIDSLKNSLELNYFKEKYAAFYSIAINRVESERLEHKKHTIASFTDDDKCLALNEELTKTEYKGKEVNSGKFTSPDIENCIQKSDYHIFYSEKYEEYGLKELGYSELQASLEVQLVKFIALIFHPGIITPTGIERTMQIAFNAKYNSGCISRQVGAVITDKNMSVKAVGWNDVPTNQIPCNLRSVDDLIKDNNSNHFSEFEKGESKLKYKDKKSFKEKLSELKVDSTKLGGRNCSFCFKSCHNAFELKDNQVHTRSLHAEENAMLQITKFGGQGVQGGMLFTTASPCELCSKKAFQLGIKKIFYIDPYPGISGSHILKSGKEDVDNPQIIMFQGAVGRGFHKLYEPLMAYKDELNIRANVHPKMDDKSILIEALTDDEVVKQKIREVLGINNPTD